VGYFELKLHKYILGTTETNITSSKKGHNRCPLSFPPFLDEFTSFHPSDL